MSAADNASEGVESESDCRDEPAVSPGCEDFNAERKLEPQAESSTPILPRKQLIAATAATTATLAAISAATIVKTTQQDNTRPQHECEVESLSDGSGTARLCADVNVDPTKLVATVEVSGSPPHQIRIEVQKPSGLYSKGFERANEGQRIQVDSPPAGTYSVKALIDNHDQIEIDGLSVKTLGN